MAEAIYRPFVSSLWRTSAAHFWLCCHAAGVKYPEYESIQQAQPSLFLSIFPSWSFLVNIPIQSPLDGHRCVSTDLNAVKPLTLYKNDFENAQFSATTYHGRSPTTCCRVRRLLRGRVGSVKHAWTAPRARVAPITHPAARSRSPPSCKTQDHRPRPTGRVLSVSPRIPPEQTCSKLICIDVPSPYYGIASRSYLASICRESLASLPGLAKCHKWRS